jgi:hypothetical protein
VGSAPPKPIRCPKAEWVNVKKGQAHGDLVGVLGDLKPGDEIVRRATDEIRDRTPPDHRHGRSALLNFFS